MDYIEKEMRKFEEALKNFHIPRYEDFPDIELYMDQVVAVLNKNLYIIAENNDNIITPSMVNNYVKFGLIPSPVGKRYTRKHLCYMTALCFLKQILSMNEIKVLVTHQIKHSSELEAYNLFCDELEKAFRKFSTSEDVQNTIDAKNYCIVHCAKAIAYKLHAQRFIQVISHLPKVDKKVEKKLEQDKHKTENSEIKDKKVEKKTDNSKK